MHMEQKTPVLPASPSSSKTTDSKWQPYEVDPEMANAKLANDLVTMCGRPGIVSKEFVIFHGILKGINHIPPTYEDVKISIDAPLIKGIIMGEIMGKPGYMRVMIEPGNATYFDSSRILAVFDGVFANTVNINGALFEKIWQYLMKPKMIIQGMPGQMSFQEEQKESLLDKARSWFTGGKKNDSSSDNK